MSRVGKRPLAVPKGVTVKIEGNTLTLKGPKGELKRKFHESVVVAQEGSNIVFKQKTPDIDTKKFWGLSRAMAATMVEGVTNGFTRTLNLVGVGYRANPKGKGITMTVGLSHPVDFDPPAGITLTVDKQTTIVVAGADKALVGDTAACIRNFRPPEPYHGKGVRYSDEVVHQKVGKAAVGTTGGAAK